MATINQNYQEVLKQDTGAEFVKVDLHVHTPASGDAQWKSRYNCKFNIKNIPASLQCSKELAEEIVKETIKKKIRLMAVTDHNSPSDTHPLNPTNSWYELLRDAAKGKPLTVLPGVEISTNDLHILVILDPKEDEPPVYTMHRIHSLLQDCGFSLSEYGDFTATGTSSLYDVLGYIEDLSTSCIAIPAHIDGGNKALLAVHKKPSNVYRKLLNHPNLNVVEITKDNALNKKMGKRSLKEYFQHLRDKDRSPIAYIKDSDGHAIKAIGKRFSYIRMGQPDFWSLRNALENPETRIRLPSDAQLKGKAAQKEPGQDKTRVIGIAFRTGRKWDYLAFNSDLNCIIGKRRTHKSTIIDLILYGLDRFDVGAITAKEKAELKKFAVNVFITKGENIVCYSRDKMSSPPAFSGMKTARLRPPGPNQPSNCPVSITIKSSKSSSPKAPT